MLVGTVAAAPAGATSVGPGSTSAAPSPVAARQLPEHRVLPDDDAPALGAVPAASGINQAGVTVRSWGVQVQLTRSETEAVASGRFRCVQVVDLLPVPPAAKAIIRADCGELSAVAAAALPRGRCAGYTAQYRPPSGHPWTWDC